MQKTPVSYSNTVDRVVLKLPHYSLGFLNLNKILFTQPIVWKLLIFDILAFPQIFVLLNWYVW